VGWACRAVLHSLQSQLFLYAKAYVTQRLRSELPIGSLKAHPTESIYD